MLSHPTRLLTRPQGTAPSGGGSSSAARFDGSSSFMRRTQDFGLPEVSFFLAVMEFKIRTGLAVSAHIAALANSFDSLNGEDLYGFQAFISPATHSGSSLCSLNIMGDTNVSGGVFHVSTNAFLQREIWYQAIVSWSIDNKLQLYINDAVPTIASSGNSQTNLYFDGGGGNNSVIGGAEMLGNGGQDYVSLWWGDLGRIWFDTSTDDDISVTATRRKFITAGLAPVDLGANGGTPFGYAPDLYLKNPYASYGVNSGNSGNYTIVGSLSDAAGPTTFGAA